MGSGANARLWHDGRMPGFVPIKALFKGRHFDQEIVVEMPTNRGIVHHARDSLGVCTRAVFLNFVFKKPLTIQQNIDCRGY